MAIQFLDGKCNGIVINGMESKGKVCFSFLTQECDEPGSCHRSVPLRTCQGMIRGRSAGSGDPVSREGPRQVGMDSFPVGRVGVCGMGEETIFQP